MRRDLAGYARSGAWSVAAHAAQLIGAMVLSIVVVRALSTEEVGVLSLARQLTALAVMLSGLALERVLLRFVPELVQSGGSQAAIRFFWRTLALRCGAWILVFGATWFFGPLLDGIFHISISRLALLGVGTGLLFSFHNHVRAAATARFATAAVARGTGISSVLTLLLTIWALEAGQGVAGVLVAAGIGVFCGSLWMLGAAIHGGPRGMLEQRVAGSGEAEFSLRSPRFRRYALPFAGIAILNFAVHSPTEVFFLGSFQGPAAAGYFNVGFSFAQKLIDFLPLALWEVSMAGFSRIAVREPEQLPAALSAYLSLLYLVMAPLALLGIGFSGPAILLLYGEKMLPAVVVAQAYFVMAAFAAFGAPVGMILYARERVAAALRAYLIFAAANLALDLALIPLLGLWGAILGLGLAKLLAVLLMSRIAWREVPGLRVPWTLMGRAFLASSPALLWLPVQERWVELWQITLGAAVIVTLILLLYRLLRVVGPREFELIASTRLPLRRPLLGLVCSAEVRRRAEASA